MHVNTVDYNEQRDEVIITSHSLHELYVIDRSTTTAEARGHTGGRHGKGGDLIYRWGNPQVYARGTSADQALYVAHGGNWVRPGMPGAGNILTLNNGDRPGTSGDSSVVVEITPPLDSSDHYYIHPDSAFGPRTPAWSYSNGRSFYSQHLGGAYRLPNGNTLATLGVSGMLHEITPARQVAWSYNTGSQVARASKYPRDFTGVSEDEPGLRTPSVEVGSNPFRGSTTISYLLPAAGRIELTVHDAAGRIVARLVDAEQDAGTHDVRLSPANENRMPAGVYFARLSAGSPNGTETTATVRLVLAER